MHLVRWIRIAFAYLTKGFNIQRQPVSRGDFIYLRSNSFVYSQVNLKLIFGVCCSHDDFRFRIVFVDSSHYLNVIHIFKRLCPMTPNKKKMTFLTFGSNPFQSSINLELISKFHQITEFFPITNFVPEILKRHMAKGRPISSTCITRHIEFVALLFKTCFRNENCVHQSIDLKYWRVVRGLETVE